MTSRVKIDKTDDISYNFQSAEKFVWPAVYKDVI